MLKSSSDNRDYRSEAKKWASVLHDPEARVLAEEAAEIILRRGFDLPDLVEKKLPKGKLAAYTGDTNEIWVSSQKPKGGWIKHLKEREESGYSSHANSILHEFGHYIHSLMAPMDYDTSGYNRGDYNKPPENGIVARYLSEYATVSIKEFEAELMAGILSGKSYPPEIINGSWLRNISLQQDGADERAQELKRRATGVVPNTSMIERQFGEIMEAVFHEEGASLRIDILKDPAVSKFIDSHAQVLDNAFQYTGMSDTMRERLRESDWMFSGYKTFHELNEAFPSLVDENGVRKPFNRFLKDVQSIDETYNRNWLRAEYNFAGASAQMAAKWERYAEDGDDYYLQYRTANDGAVRPEHAALHGVTLPQSDSFWDTYYPPNGWNCRCTVVQVRKSKYEQTPHDEAMAKGSAALAKDTKGMFRFNPGKQKSAFPAYNPYTISKCRNCDKSQFRLADGRYVASNDLCAACLFLQECKVKEHEFIIAGDGMIKVSRLVDPKGSDYKKIMEVAEFFAQGGATVELTPKMSRPAEFLYDCIYGDLRGTPYEGKCPDMRVDGVWYEHEGFTTEDPKNAFRNMMNHGLKQSSRIIIDQPGLTDAFMKKSIYRRIEKYEQAIDEVWVREPEGIRPLYKRSKD